MEKECVITVFGGRNTKPFKTFVWVVLGVKTTSPCLIGKRRIGNNIIERLEELYVRDFGELLDTYKTLEGFDPVLFKELGIDLTTVREGLKMKIKGLKNLYWQELFSNLDSITNRLTSKSREHLLEKLTNHTSVDYTADNAYAVVIWVVKNANQYFDDPIS